MIKKTITYTDYDGLERTEDFYFNLTKAELIEMEFEIPGGMQQMLEKIIAEKDTVKIGAIFKEIITRSYGEKSPDGKRFVKSKEISDAFMQTEAYSELYVSLFDEGVAAAFANGIIPKVPEPTNVSKIPAPQY